MARLNWQRDKDRRRLDRQGFEPAKDEDKPPFVLPPGKRWRKRIPKAQLRMIANAAIRESGS